MVAAQDCSPELRRLRQEDWEFQNRVNYTVRLLKKNSNLPPEIKAAIGGGERGGLGSWEEQRDQQSVRRM